MANNIPAFNAVDYPINLNPGNPVQGNNRIYTGRDGNLKYRTPAGLESSLVGIGGAIGAISPGDVILVGGASHATGNSDYGAPNVAYRSTASWIADISTTFLNLSLTAITEVNTAVAGQTSTAMLAAAATQLTGPIVSNNVTVVVLEMDILLNDLANAIGDNTSRDNVIAMITGATGIRSVTGSAPIYLLLPFSLGSFGVGPTEDPSKLSTLYNKVRTLTAGIQAAIAAGSMTNVIIVDALTMANNVEIEINQRTAGAAPALDKGILINESGPHLSIAGTKVKGDALRNSTAMVSPQGTLVPWPRIRGEYGLNFMGGPRELKRFQQTCYRISKEFDEGRVIYNSNVDVASGAVARANDALFDRGRIKGAAGTRMLADMVIFAGPTTGIWAFEIAGIFGAAAGGSTAELGLKNFTAGAPDFVRFRCDQTGFGNTHIFFQLIIGGGGTTSLDLGATTTPDGKRHRYGAYYGFVIGNDVASSTITITYDGAVVGQQTTLTNLSTNGLAPYISDTAGETIQEDLCMINTWGSREGGGTQPPL